DLEVAVRLGARGAKEPTVEVVKKAAALAKAVRPLGNGGVELALGNTRIELTGPAPAQSGLLPKIDVRGQYKSQFTAADKDNNGYLDEKEARASPLFAGAVKLMDRAGAGKLYLKEVLAYLDALDGLQKAAVAGCASMAVSDRGQGLFDLADLDKDGRLSVRELRQLAKLIDKLDLDGDGALSPREVPRTYRASFRKGPADPNAFGPRIAVLGGPVVPAPPLPRRAGGPVGFRATGRNPAGRGPPPQ